MKKYWVILLLLSSIVAAAQGNKGKTEACAPMKKGKVCYTDEVDVPGKSKQDIFNAIDIWAKKNYGRDVFMSNVNANKSKYTVLVSSKIELLLNDSTKTFLSYKMFITCDENKYSSEMRNLVYQYDAEGDKRFRTYKAEEVIADNGLSNTAATVKDPVLFCNATFFFAENLFGELSSAVTEQLDNDSN